MNPATPKNELQPSTPLRKVVFGGSLYISLLAVLMIASLPLDARQDPQGKDTGYGYCSLHGNYKGSSCPKCAVGGGGNSSNPSGIDYEAVRLNDLIARFNVLLNHFREYDIPNIGDLYDGATPATINELGRRVDRLYVETAFYKSRRYWMYEQNTKYLASFPATLSALRKENFELQERLNMAPERLKNAETRRDQNMAKAESEELVARMLRNNAAIVEDDLLIARGDAIWTIFELLPANRKAAFREAAIKGKAFPAYTVQKLQEPPSVGVTPPLQPVGKPGKGMDFGPSYRPPPIAGSIEAKLNAFEHLKSVLDYASPIWQIPSQEKKLAVFRTQAKELRNKNESLFERLRTFESPLEKAKALADNVEDRFLRAQVNEKISANNLLRLATAALMWDHIKHNVVIPQIEQVLKKNDFLGTLKGTAMIDRIRKNPQEFLPKVGPMKDLQRLIETGKKVLSVEENMESFALEMAAATGQRGTAESDILIVHVFSSLGKQGKDIMLTASGAMKGPQGKIARVLMERAPKE